MTETLKEVVLVRRNGSSPGEARRTVRLLRTQTSRIPRYAVDAGKRVMWQAARQMVEAQFTAMVASIRSEGFQVVEEESVDMTTASQQQYAAFLAEQSKKIGLGSWMD